MAITQAPLFLYFFALVVFISTVSGYANLTALCEEVRLIYLQNGTYNTTDNIDNLKCGAQFSEDTEPALVILTNLTFCMARTPGYQPSYRLSQWAGPLFNFLVPALSFVLVINRPARFVPF